MAILTFPQIHPDSLQWHLANNTQTFTSPLSGATQTLAQPGARWSATMSFRNRRGDELRELQTFITALRGSAGRFRLHNFAQPIPRGTATGSPLVSGSNQLGNTLSTDSWTASTVGIMRAGDYFQVGNELKMLTTDSDSDPGGATTLNFEPPLRFAPTDGSTIIINKPTAIFRLTDDRQGRFSHRHGGLADTSIQCIEAFY